MTPPGSGPWIVFSGVFSDIRHVGWSLGSGERLSPELGVGFRGQPPRPPLSLRRPLRARLAPIQFRKQRKSCPVRPVIAGQSHRHTILKRDPPLSCAPAGRGSTDVGGRSTIAYPPKTSRRTVVRSSRACSPFPAKLEPCMMASVLGFRSANFLRIPAVIGV